MVPALHARLAFVTRYRRRVLDEEMLACCEQAMREACEEFGVGLAEFNGQDNHAHLPMTYPPKVAISALVNSLKGASAPLRVQFTDRVNRVSIHSHSWSPS